jgi:Type I restriction modification DNA specificity domain
MANPIPLMALSEVFDVQYGGSFSRVADYKSGSTPVIKSQATNNGVIAHLSIEPNHAHVLTVARTGSVGASFYHEYPCYVTDDCMVLQPKSNMSAETMLIYARLVFQNAFKYNYGRKVTPTRLSLEKIPTPKYVESLSDKLSIPKKPSPKSYNHSNGKIALDQTKWKFFRYDEIFEIRKGYYNKKPPLCARDEGDCLQFIGASESNNGVTSYHRLEDIQNFDRSGSIESYPTTIGKVFPANAITVANNGASVGFAFFQPNQFVCSHDVNPLYLRDKVMTPEIGLFLCTLIRMERYRWNYGRKWRPSRMPYSSVKLPVLSNGDPDWKFMENYIKSLPYSASL